MKKILESKLFLIVLTTMLATTFSVFATTSILSNQVSYTNSKTAETTVEGSLNELFSAVDINNRLGNNDISSIGDGTVSGAIKQIKDESNSLNNNVGKLKLVKGAVGHDAPNPVTLDLSSYAALLVVRRANAQNGGTQAYIITNATRATVLKIATEGTESVSVVNNGDGTITLTSSSLYWNYSLLSL